MNSPMHSCLITLALWLAPAAAWSATASFQQGAAGYVGAVDTHVSQANPGTAYGAQATVEWDGEDAGGATYALVRFENIFGTGPGQIPPSSMIASARLEYTVSNAGNVGQVNEVAVDWSEATTWNTFGGDAGVQADEYAAAVGTATGIAGLNTLDVTASLARWSANPAVNRGWIFRPTGTDGVDFASASAASGRPKLVVEYAAITGVTFIPQQLASVAGAADVPVLLAIPAAANATNPVQVTLTSDALQVAVPVGAVGGSLTVTFAAGGPAQQTVLIDIGQAGSANILTANNAGLSQDKLTVEVGSGAVSLNPPTLAAIPGEVYPLKLAITPGSNQTRSIQVTLATDAAATATPAGAVGGALAVTFAAGGPREQAVDLVIGQLGAATLASSNDGGLANATTSVTVQDGFHFTATADPRTQVTKWDDVLAAINAKCGGPGAFHTSSGDIDPLQPLRDRIDSRFGAAALWYPGVGNHEAETVEDMAWIRAEYHTGNAVRVPLSGFTNQDGPAGTVETNYTFDVGNARFIQLNEYWNGAATPGSDVGAGGAIVPALQSWLTAKMAESNQAAVFVLGHEPAYPENRHVGDSLDANPAQRNQFWDSMESAGALSYICGHTHFYSTHQQPGGRIWQIDLGNAGNDGGDGLTFLNTVVMPAEVRYDVWRNAGGSWHLAESWLQPIPQRLRVTPTVMDRQVFLGKPLSADSFEVQAVGPGTLAYVINDDAPWLTVSESSGSSAGEADAIELSYATADLPVGQHTGRVTVSGPAGVAPRVLTVNLTVRTVKGDFDQDSDVDQDDFGHLQKCLNGSAPQLDPLCADARLDGDEYVNGGDIDRFLACYSGPEIEASPACEN